MCRSCRVCCTECKCSHPRGLSSPASKNRDENILYLPLRIYFFILQDMNIPLSHTRQYLHREHISHNIICLGSLGSRLPPKVVSRHVCTADKPQTAASQWGAHHCLHSHQKRATIFLCMQRSITKVLQSIAADQTLFPFFLDANRTLPEDRRVGAFPKFTDLASCDSH